MEEVIFKDSDIPIYFGVTNTYDDWGNNSVFRDCPLREVYFGRNLVRDMEESSEKKWRDGFSPFYYNKDIVSFSIGPNVVKCRSLVFDRCENLQSINCYSLNPPQILNATTAQYTLTIVNIPQGSLGIYQKSNYWENFWNLNEILPTPNVMAEQILLNIEEAEIPIGETVQLEATVLPEDVTDPTIIWYSSDPNITTVSENGLVTAISAGTSIISAVCGEVSAECAVTVLEDAGVESILAKPDSSISIYRPDGILIKKDSKVEDLKNLNKGIYIIVSGKEHYKISI